MKLKDIIFEQEQKPKAVLLAGGAGAGKSYLLDQLKLDTLPLMNPDKYIEDPDSKMYGNLAAASAQTAKDVEAAADAKQSFVYDTTASNPEKVRELLSKGYDVYMIMVYTHPMISFIANFSRERRIPKAAVFSTWKRVYKLIEDYRRMLGDNFSLFVNTREGKYDKETKAFNKAAETGARSVENYLKSFIEKNGGKEAFSSTFRKPFELPKEMQDKYQELIANTTVPEDDESAHKELKKDLQKYFDKYQAGSYGSSRLQDKFNSINKRREKLKANERKDLEDIASMLTNSNFQDLLQTSTVQKIDKKVQKFLK